MKRSIVRIKVSVGIILKWIIEERVDMRMGDI
jgi:hypothetical protein